MQITLKPIIQFYSLFFLIQVKEYNEEALEDAFEVEENREKTIL